ncbi:MAG: HlyD family efflux transporter periplasmic adaptor subunit [Methylococcales bacterium]|nr:HlyD family efflux transporter periplasmic adaptor subunit [Methylococcales bacterium]
MTEQRNKQLLQLTLLLQLEQRARLAPVEELPYILVNETTDLLPYRQALLWQRDTAKIKAASGVALPEKNSPYALWINVVLKQLSHHENADSAIIFTANDLPPDTRREWAEWLPEHGLWLPLPAPLGVNYILVLFREEQWKEGEIHLLSYLAEAYGHALALAESAQPKRPLIERLRDRRLQIIIAAVITAALCFPIRQSVLTEAEVIPYHANLIRAPLEGVVEKFFVQPNESVTVGQKLFELDMAQLRSRLSVAEETRDIAKTEYLQTTQQAMLDPTAKSKLAVLKSKWDQQIAEVDYVRSLLERCEVTANKAGVTVFDDPNDWLGKPVTQGEKILAIADPQSVELEIRLPMDDLIELDAGNEVLFFSNVSPNQPLPASLSYFSYRASATPAQVMAYRLKAQFADSKVLPRLGYRGVAKLYGTRQAFVLWLLRKPIRTVRLWLAW